MGKHVLLKVRDSGVTMRSPVQVGPQNLNLTTFFRRDKSLPKLINHVLTIPKLNINFHYTTLTFTSSSVMLLDCKA